MASSYYCLGCNAKAESRAALDHNRACASRITDGLIMRKVERKRRVKPLTRQLPKEALPDEMPMICASRGCGRTGIPVRHCYVGSERAVHANTRTTNYMWRCSVCGNTRLGDPPGSGVWEIKPQSMRRCSSCDIGKTSNGSKVVSYQERQTGYGGKTQIWPLCAKCSGGTGVVRDEEVLRRFVDAFAIRLPR